MYTLVTGDDALILQTLKIGASAFNVTGLTIKSRLIGKNCRTALTDEITNSDATAGADWANGVVAVVVPGTETEEISPVEHPTVLLETQANDGTYDKTWFTEIELAAGTIA
jgi:hypothetical protein